MFLPYNRYEGPERYEIKDLTPPKEILHAMQQQITAEREKRALIAASEGRKQEQINIANGQRESFIARSEGEKQAEINKAQGEAAAISAVAEATAEAIRKIAAAIQQPGGDQAVQLKVAERAVDAFAQLAQKTNTMIVPGNMTEVAALVGSAMALMRGAHVAPGANIAPPPR
jgi:regulator of protease activity HflC (stomatin/prohibitin superfamily)